MKKLLFLLSIFLILTTNAYAVNTSSDAFTVSGDVTIAHLEGFRQGVVNKINNLPGSYILDTTITSVKLDNNANPEYRWGETFNNWVYTGLLAPTTSATLTSTTTLGTAYIKDTTLNKMVRVVKDATAHLYVASKDTYVDLSNTGTYTYSQVALAGTAPATASNSTRLFMAKTDGTQVTTVTDLRTTAVSLTVEDQYINGLELITVSPDVAAVTVDAGICYAGSTRIKKTIATKLTFATATDWWDGDTDSYAASAQGDTQWNYIGINSDGDIKFLGVNPPAYADTSGNIVGNLKYSKPGTDYWRVLGAVRMTTGNTLALHFKQNGDWIQYLHTSTYVSSAHIANPLVQILPAGTATSFTNINVSHDVPSFGTMINIDLWGSSGDYITFAVDDANGGRSVYVSVANSYSSIYNLPITDRNLQYAVNGSNFTVYCAGYYLGNLR